MNTRYEHTTALRNIGCEQRFSLSTGQPVQPVQLVQPLQLVQPEQPVHLAPLSLRKARQKQFNVSEPLAVLFHLSSRADCPGEWSLTPLQLPALCVCATLWAR